MSINGMFTFLLSIPFPGQSITLASSSSEVLDIFHPEQPTQHCDKGYSCHSVKQGQWSMRKRETGHQEKMWQLGNNGKGQMMTQAQLQPPLVKTRSGLTGRRPRIAPTLSLLGSGEGARARKARSGTGRTTSSWSRVLS